MVGSMSQQVATLVTAGTFCGHLCDAQSVILNNMSGTVQSVFVATTTDIKLPPMQTHLHQ